MLKITAEEINFLVYQYLHESGKCCLHSEWVLSDEYTLNEEGPVKGPLVQVGPINTIGLA